MPRKEFHFFPVFRKKVQRGNHKNLIGMFILTSSMWQKRDGSTSLRKFGLAQYAKNM